MHNLLIFILGPAIVTKDDITDPHNLNLKCHVNNCEKQNFKHKPNDFYDMGHSFMAKLFFHFESRRHYFDRKSSGIWEIPETDTSIFEGKDKKHWVHEQILLFKQQKN